MLNTVRSAIARTRGWVSALSSVAAEKRREPAARPRRTSARPLGRMATGLVAGLALALAAPSVAFAASAGCNAINGFSGTYTIDGAGNGTDHWAAGAANGEVVTYSWSGNTKGAYVYVMYTRGDGAEYFGLVDATAESGSGSFTTSGTGDVNDFYEVGIKNYPNSTSIPDASKNNSTVNLTVSCSAPPPAPVASSFTYGSIVAYNDGGDLPTNLSLAFTVTNDPTNFAVVSSTTAQGGSVSVDSAGSATYVPPVGFRGNDSFQYNATNAGGTSSNATVTISVGNPTFAVASALPNGVTGVAYSQQASLTGGKAPYSTFSASGLPAGLSMNASGLITGTPTQTGTFNLTITARDSSTGTGPYTSSAQAPLTVVSGADLQAAWQGAGSSVTAGQTAALTAQLTNPGTGPAASVSAQFVLPPQLTFSSVTTPAGWTCITPAVGTTGTVSCTKTSVAAGAFEMFTLTVGAPASASPATTSVALNVTSATETETASKSLTVLAPDMQSSLTGPASVNRGQNATLTLTLTNAGTAATPHASWSTTLPTGLTFASLSTPAGWSCITPAVGVGGLMSCAQLSGIAVGASQVFTLVAGVGATAASTTTVNISALTTYESEPASVSFGVVDATPTLSGIMAPRGPSAGGANVVLQGANLSTATAVTWGGTSIPFLVISNTQIQVTTPAGAVGTAASVTVTTPGGTSGAVQFAYVDTPTVTGLTPSDGPAAGGTNVVIHGTNLAFASGVTLGGASVPFTLISDNAIQITTPAGSGTADVVVSVPYIGSSVPGASARFTYNAAPTVTSISPTSGASGGGTTVTLTGTNFSGATAVTFGGTAATGYTVLSGTSISATAPAGTGTVDVRVTTAGGTSAISAADQFTYVAAPTVTSITPPFGPQAGGGTVTLTGTNFFGATAVTFGGVAASNVTVLSGTSITAKAPAGIGTVDVQVTTAGGTSATSAADQFTYVPTPVLSGISPNTGSTFGGDTVVITGSGLTMTGMVTFGGTTASFTVNSDTKITVVNPPHAAGAVDVAVVSPGGSGAYVGGFTYFVPQVSLPASVASGTIGQAYSGSVAAPHANSYNVTSGSLAPGLTLNSSTGEITGTPSGAGDWNFVVTAGGETGWSGSAQAYTLSIAAPTLVIADSGVSNGTVGQAYSVAVWASGGAAPYTYGLAAGAFPPGLTLDTSTGVLSGTPTAGGTFSFIVSATDSSTGTGAPFSANSAVYTVTMNAPTITVTPASVPSATATAAYSQTLTASGGTAGYTWEKTAGTLPAGVTLSTGGVLSGTPTQTGSFNFTATATDSSSGTRYSGSQAYTLVVAAPTVTVSPGSLPNPRAGTAYSQTLSAGGAQGPYTFGVTAGALPAGLTLSQGGVLSGTPTETGVFNITVTATDSTAGTGFTGSAAYTLTVGVPNLDLQPSALPNGQQGESYSLTVVASGGTAPYTYTVTGGTGLPAGVTLSSGGVLSGTPTQSGVFSFAVIARDSTTGSGAPYQVGRGYTWTVDVAAPPTAAATSVNVPYASAGTAIDLTPKVGGVVSSIAVAQAPAHGTVSVSGYVVTYTPAAGYFGDDGFTYTATGPGGTSAPATVSLTVAVPPAPTTADASAAIGFNSAGQAIDLSGSVSGVYSSIAVAQAPAHGTVSVSGAVVTYTPAADHYGADSFTYTATGPGGTSAPATVSLTVDNPPPPVPAPQPGGPAQVVAGAEVGVTVTNTGGLATGVQITTPPAHGTVTVDPLVTAAAVRPSASTGFVLTYTPNPGYSGPDSFAYALVGPGGTSQPQQVQVTVLPSVTLAPIEVSTLQGVPVQVDVTAGASGGPYTGAAVVSVGPSSSGTASFAQVGASRVLTFTPADDFTGVAVVTYTVSNANSTSAPSTVTVTVDARPNPALDADVRGLIGAQVQAAQRFVDTQVQNFSQRAEQLHGQGDQEGPRKHALNLSFGLGDYAGGRPEDPASEIRRREMPERPFADQARRLDELALAAADADASSPGGLGPIGGGKVALWSAGSIDFGQRHADAGGSKLKFTTSGVSLGADIEVADGLFVGVGAGYGYDATDIGSEGTRNASRSYMGAVYGSWRIAPQLYLDGVAGLGELSFDSRRIAANDATVIGRRDGSQAFGSISLAFDHNDGPMTVSSYGRLTVSKAKLDAFTETGDPIFALAYDAQDVDASFGTLGVRGQWAHAMEDGSFTPRVRAEWRRQLSGADAALVRYADFLTGPSYQVDPLEQSQNTLLLGLGGDWRWDEGMALSLDYEGQVGDESLSHRVTLKVSTRF